MSSTFSQDTTFSIEKIVQNAYKDPDQEGLPATYLNSVLGECMSNLVAVDETDQSGNKVQKLYLAYVTDISFTNIDTVSGNIAIARFDKNLNLENIFRSTQLNSTNGREAYPTLCYANKRLFIAYSTNAMLINTEPSTFDISKSGSSFDLVIAGMDIFNFNTTVQSEPIIGIRDIDILWLKQSTTFNTTSDEAYSAFADLSNQAVAPSLTYDKTNNVLYCAYSLYKTTTDYDINILAVNRALGIQIGSGPYTRSYSLTSVVTQLINLPQSTTSAPSTSSSSLNTSSKDLYPAIAVDISGFLHLMYRTESSGNFVGTSSKNISTRGDRYIYCRFSPPDFTKQFSENNSFAGQYNYWQLTDISNISLNTNSANIYSQLDMIYYNGSLYVGTTDYNTTSSTAYAVVAKMNAHGPVNFDTAIGNSAYTGTGATVPSSVKVIPNIRDPSNNETVVLIYQTYPTASTINVNLARYTVSGTVNADLIFRDFTTDGDLSGFNINGKITRNPSAAFLDGYLYVDAEVNAATYYTNLENQAVLNKYAANATITGNYDIAIAKINMFKANRVRDISLTEGIQFVELQWGNTIATSIGGPVNWWPPTLASSYGYRVSYRRTGEEADKFIDLADLAYSATDNRIKIGTTDSTDVAIPANLKVLVKGYQYEFIVRAVINGCCGDYANAILRGMPVDGYVITSLNGATSKLLPSLNTLTLTNNSGAPPTGSDAYTNVSNNTVILNLSGGVAYNIAVRSYVTLKSTEANYSLTDQSGIVIPRYAAPTTLTISGMSYCIKVTWTTVSGDNIDGYEIQYSKDSNFTSPSKILYPVTGVNPNTSVSAYLAYNPGDLLDCELQDASAYFVRVRAVGGKNLTSVNGINLAAGADGYRVYGLFNSSASTSTSVSPQTPAITVSISGEANVFKSNPGATSISGTISSTNIWPQWITVGSLTNVLVCITINGYRFTVANTNVDYSLTTANIAAGTMRSTGITSTVVNPATLYNVQIFLCNNTTFDPIGKIISRKVTTLPLAPTGLSVTSSSFNANAVVSNPSTWPTLTVNWSYTDAGGYPDLAGFKVYYRRTGTQTFETPFDVPTRTATSTVIPNVPGGAGYDVYVRAYVSAIRGGVGHIRVPTADSVTPESGETSSAKNGTTIYTPPVNTITRVLPSNTSTSFFFDDSTNNKDLTSYIVTISGVGAVTYRTNTTYSKSGLLTVNGLASSTSYIYILSISGVDTGRFNFTNVSFTTASRTAQDISINTVTAGPQSFTLLLTRPIRSMSGENIVITYNAETATTATFGPTTYRRYYATDSSQVVVTGLFPSRDISNIKIYVEEFYPETNLFYYSPVYSFPGSTVKPTYYSPRAPTLTSATPGLMDTTVSTPYQATITWSPNINFK